MAKHQNLSSPFAVHPFAFSSNADPSNDGSIDMAPYKGWINTGSSNTLKVRNAANTAWEDVSVAGAANTPAFGSNSNSVAVGNVGGASTLASRADHVHLGVRSIAHASNTFSGPITLTTPGNTVGITSPGTGQLAFTATATSTGGAAALASDRVALTTSDLTTTSTSFVDATGMSITMTTGARKVLIAVTAATELSAVPGDICLDIDVDGARLGGSFGICTFQHVTAARRANQAFTVSTAALTAGSHTFKLQWRVTTGTGTLYRSTTVPLIMTAVEI